MANRIMGITVEIGGDTTKLQTTLKGVNGQIKSTQQHSYDILIYDNVPGGAGHVKRLVEKNAVITSLNAAYL